MGTAILPNADLLTAAPVAAPVEFRYNGNRSNPAYYPGHGMRKPPDMLDRKVIAWDMEGMNLSGDGKPQHAVIFGCSADPKPMQGQNLTSLEMLQYIVEMGAANPHAIHVGFGFRYDANMLIKGLPTRLIINLWRRGHVRFRTNDGMTWNLSWIPGKRFAVSRWPGLKKHAKVSVLISDYSSFFGGQAFLPTAEDILRDKLSDADRDTIARGKAQRGVNVWADFDDVLYYWEREIQLIRRCFERFRDVMYTAGFKLKDWYGPGGLANYINTVRGIRPHLGAAQITSGVMPDEVHMASKIAFSGGRFETPWVGRFTGPVYSIDKNGAYPEALTMIPSLHPDEGEWRHIEKPSTIKRFGFYRVTFRAAEARVMEARMMPLFWRNPRGMITYPNRVTGWYASPEARMVLGMPGVTIHEGWYWQSDERIWPWEFLHEMYQTRQRLGKQNLLSLPFKLGPNSLYGKYAQTVGFNRKDKLPPKSHALPIAAWVTSYCRSQLWGLIRQAPASIVAVETDSVMTTENPETWNVKIGDGLGQWKPSQYDEVLYLQSGMYHTREGDEWNGVRSRGISRAELAVENSAAYLRSLVPGENWAPLTVTTKPRFIGAGMALASSAPFKMDHCAWRPQNREITFGGTGKRQHIPFACQACQHGSTPYDEPHRLMVISQSDGETLSTPRRLPWEMKQTPEIAAFQKADMLDRELISR